MNSVQAAHAATLPFGQACLPTGRLRVTATSVRNKTQKPSADLSSSRVSFLDLCLARTRRKLLNFLPGNAPCAACAQGYVMKTRLKAKYLRQGNMPLSL